MSKRRRRKQKRRFYPFRLVLVLLGFALTAGALWFLISLITPHHRFTIVIDPAYGGSYSGYEGYINEADYARKVADALAVQFEEDKIDVFVSHPADRSMSADARAQFIKENKADMVLSIRADYDPDPEVSGLYLYADKPSSSANKKSLRFAETIRSAFEGTRDARIGYLYYKPVRADRYEVQFAEADDRQNYNLETFRLMELSDCPVVVYSGLYVSNESEVAEWGSDEGCLKTAELLAEAIRAYAKEAS